MLLSISPQFPLQALERLCCDDNYASVKFRRLKPVDMKLFVKNILLAFLIMTVATGEQDAENRVLKWAFHPPPVPFGSIVFNGTLTVSLYRSVNIPTLFFYPPLGLLVHSSASIQLDARTATNQIAFDIIMWNDQLRKEIIHYLSQIMGQSVRNYQLQVMPYDRVLLKSRRPSDSYRLTDEWLHLSSAQSKIRFAINCIEDCDRLVTQIRSNPERFKHWRLLYAMEGHQERIREVSVRQDHISRSILAGELNRKFPSPTDRVLLMSSDANQLVSKAVANIISESFDDDEAVTVDSVRQINSWLVDKLQITKEIIGESWELVYWKDQRPDKLCETLNQLLDSEAAETMYDQLNYKTKELIRWDGEKFITNNQSVAVGFKLDFIRSKSKAWQQQRIKVSFSQAELDLPVRINASVDTSEEDFYHQIGSLFINKFVSYIFAFNYLFLF